jgi:malate dehydrogenase (oxaloacetate-decarboxylating)(NADP+)
VVLAGLYSAMRITGGRLADQRILVLGGGSAGVGCGDLICAAMAGEGLSLAQARGRYWLFDSHGLVVRSRTDLESHKRRFAHDHQAPTTDFLAAIEALRPTVLIGASGQPRRFTREVIEAMSRINERPIVLALSNPTSLSECTAEEAYAASNGRAIFASGSPFDPVRVHGKTFAPGQGNNAYVFPGVGLGIVCSAATRVSDAMFAAAARTLASMVSESDLERGCIFPPLSQIRDVSARIAAAVAAIARDEGTSRESLPEDLEAHVRSRMYQPVYPRYA